MARLFSAILLAALLGQQSPGKTAIFWNVAVVDVEAGTTRTGMAVEIAGGRIMRVREADGAAPREGTVVDGTGKYLIPGLWDSHVHLTKLGVSSLALFLANGVTSVRDMGSDLDEVLKWRRDIESGARPGPRIRTAGQILESRSNVDRMIRERTVEPVDRIRLPVASPSEAQAVVARLADGGADFLKVRTIADGETFTAIAAAARSRGLKLTGHAVASPEGLLETGMASVEHALSFPPLNRPAEQRRALFERMRDTGLHLGTTTVNLRASVLVPYATAVERLRNDPLRRYVGRYLASDWAEQVEEKKSPEAERMREAFTRALPAFVRDFREMHEAGVKFLAGSDAAVVFIHPGFSLHGELESLVREVGLNPADAILVLCSHDTVVADRAAQLYFDGWAPLLIFSGGLGSLTSRFWEEPEANQFARIAIASLSPDDVISIMVGDLQRIRVYPSKGFQIPQEIPNEVWRAFEELVAAGYDRHLVGG